MRNKIWGKTIAILIVGLFFAGTVQVGLSMSEKKTDLALKISEKDTSFNPLATGWVYRKQITIDHTQVDDDLTDFPVFISITDLDLQAEAQADGDDILYMSYTGVPQQLNHEIESYDGTTGELCAWVNLPSVSSTVDTIFYVYYGNSACSSQQHVAETWNDHFMAVWHLQNNPTGTIYDSTQFNNDGIAHGAMSTSDLVDGMAGKCLDFDGVDDYISVPDSTSLKPTDLTLIAWYKPQDLNPSAAGNFLVKQSHDYWGNPDGRSYGFWKDNNNNYVSGEFEIDAYDQQDVIGNLPIVVDTWSYLALTFHKATHEGILYVNGSLNGIKNPCHSTVLWYDDPWDFNIGASRVGLGSSHVVNSFHNCALDEIRILNTPLSAGWISTEFNNQNDPSGFYSIGAEEIQQPPLTPQKPSGTTLGEVGIGYSYTTSTLDPEGDLVYYQLDWGDDSGSDWVGPFNSGTEVSSSHIWSAGGEYLVKVKAKDFFNIESLWSESLSVIMDSRPTNPQKPAGATIGAVGVEYSYTTTATDPDGDSLYYQWEWGDGSVSDWFGPFVSGMVVSASHIWSNGGDFLIKVRAKDIYLEGSWSESLHIYMDYPPQKPQRPSGTINGGVGNEYTYTTTTTDPDSEAVYFMWSWGDGNVSGWYGPSSPGVIASASHVWTEKGTYEIKVKAKDNYGFESDWSEPLSSKMPFSYQYPGLHFFEKLFERFPYMFPLLRHLLG